MSSGDTKPIRSPVVAFTGEPCGLERALFKLSAALTYEDLADAFDAFCEATVPHASRLLMFGMVDYNARNYDTLLERGINVPAPGAEYVDEELRMYFIENLQESARNNPGTIVWYGANSCPSYGAREWRDFPKTEYFRRVVEPERWSDNLSVTFWNEGNMHSCFWIKRAAGERGFSDAEAGVYRHYYPWLATALKRVRLLEDARAHSLDIAAGLFDIPVATFLLDWNLRLAQSNAACARACAAWRIGAQKARVVKLPAMTTACVPDEIKTVCREMRARWVDFKAGRVGAPIAARPGGPSGFFRRTLGHDRHAGMEATVTLLRPNALRLSQPSFLVRITNVDTPGAANGGGAGAPEARRVQMLARLTPAERELVPLLAKGLSDKEIALVLGKSVPTVKNQLRSVYEKLRIPTRTRLIAALR